MLYRMNWGKGNGKPSSTLAWKIPWMEEPGRLQSMGSLGVGHDWATSLSLSCTGEGNGNPLQYSCLENPRDDEWIRKLWYIYTMEHYSAIKKNTFESVLMRWMKLEPIIQSEVSQREKHQYSILTHIYGI